MPQSTLLSCGTPAEVRGGLCKKEPRAASWTQGLVEVRDARLCDQSLDKVADENPIPIQKI